MPPNPLNYESRKDIQHCPFCQSTSVVSGDLLGGDAVTFVPHNLKPQLFSFTRPNLLIQKTPMACSDCGALWAGLDASKLRDVLSRWGKG